mmetsp:Transcript_9943/g.37506  ORF Transcript_9943/g.37506 Transcript_9943/m.37506 type:complete len:184 (+) Transcript_9943:1188-1739(+)
MRCAGRPKRACSLMRTTKASCFRSSPNQSQTDQPFSWRSYRESAAMDALDVAASAKGTSGSSSGRSRSSKEIRNCTKARSRNCFPLFEAGMQACIFLHELWQSPIWTLRFSLSLDQRLEAVGTCFRAFHQLLVGSAFYYTTSVDHDYPIRALHGAQSVSDHHYRPPPHRAFQSILDHGLALRI